MRILWILNLNIEPFIPNPGFATPNHSQIQAFFVTFWGCNRSTDVGGKLSDTESLHLHLPQLPSFFCRASWQHHHKSTISRTNTSSDGWVVEEPIVCNACNCCRRVRGIGHSCHIPSWYYQSPCPGFLLFVHYAFKILLKLFLWFFPDYIQPKSLCFFHSFNDHICAVMNRLVQVLVKSWLLLRF